MQNERLSTRKFTGMATGRLDDVPLSLGRRGDSCTGHNNSLGIDAGVALDPLGGGAVHVRYFDSDAIFDRGLVGHVFINPSPCRFSRRDG